MERMTINAIRAAYTNFVSQHGMKPERYVIHPETLLDLRNDEDYSSFFDWHDGETKINDVRLTLSEFVTPGYVLLARESNPEPGLFGRKYLTKSIAMHFDKEGKEVGKCS